MLLTARRWRAVFAGGVAGLAIVAVATVVLGVGIWGQYLSFLGIYTSTFDQYSVEPAVMWNLRGTLTLILGRTNAPLINGLAYIGFALGLVITAYVWRRPWPRDLSASVRRDLAL